MNRKLEFSLLVVILLVAAGLRLAYPDWDDGAHAHPDERYIIWVATTIDWPVDASAIFDPERTTLDPFRWPPNPQTTGVPIPKPGPRDFTYGHFPLYLLVFAARGLTWLGHAAPQLAGTTFAADLVNASGRVEYEYLPYVGRALSALYDTASVLFIYLIGRRTFAAVAGLLGTAFTALAVLHIQLSHFATFDTALTAFALLTVWAAVRHAQSGRRRDLLIAGVGLGLAVGSKFSAVLLAIPIAAAVFGRIIFTAKVAESAEKKRNGISAASALSVVKNLAAMPFLRWRLTLKWVGALVVGFVVFALTNPFALIEMQTYFSQINAQGLMVRGVYDWPFTQQYRGTIPYWYTIEQQGRWLLGWPITAAGYAGLAVGVWRSLKTRDAATIIVLSWVLPFFLSTGSFMVKFPRYMLPVTPFVSLFGAWLLVELARRWKAVWAGTAALTGGMAIYALAFVNMYAAPHSWVALSQWIYRNVPTNAMVLTEKWDDTLPLPLEVDGAHYSYRRFQMQKVNPFEKPDAEEKVRFMLAQLSASDYLIIASNRLYGVAPRLPARYPLTGLYYQALFDERLGYEVVAVARRYPTLGGWRLVDDPFTPAGVAVPPLAEFGARDWNWGAADESFTVYDHPLAMVFQNVKRLTAVEMWEALYR